MSVRDDATGMLALDALFTTQGLLADRDGDGLVDAVRTRFVVDGKAQRPDYAAAADIAARLAFASLSYTLPLAPVSVEALPGGAIPLFIGRPSTLASGCPGLLRQALRDLQPGEGVIATAGDAEPALLVGGADDAGLAAAVSAAATALPHLRIDDEMDAPALVAAVRAVLTDHVDGALRLEAIVIRGDSVTEARIHLVRSAGTTIQADAQRRATEALAGLAASLPCALVLTADGDREGDGRAPLARIKAGERRGQPERSSPPRSTSISSPLAQARDEQAPLPEPSAAPSPPVRSLAGLYGPEGFCVDTDADLLPDTCRTHIELPDDLTPATGRQVIHLAARIGLETLGLRLPLAQKDATRGDAEAERAITIAVEPLADDHPYDADAGRLSPGEGEVRLADADAEGRARVVVRGGDEQGRALAAHLLATLDAQPAEAARTLQGAEDALRRLCALADPEARAAAALAALDQLPPESYQSGDDTLELLLPIAGAPGAAQAAAEAAVTAWARSLDPPIPVHAAVERDASPIEAASGEQTLVWEVDDVWRSLTESVFPALTGLPTGADWAIDVRVSEPPGRRAQLRRAIMAALEALGLPDAGTRVHVRPAYRQGRAWLCEEALPALHGRGVRALTIRCRRFTADEPCLELPIRWIQELHPVDELIRDDLGLPEGAVRIELGEIGPTYEVEAYGADGEVVWRSSFDVLYETRPYLPGFPEWGTVHPCTGCVRLRKDDESLVDVHITPDPERAWDVIQEALLPSLRDYVHRIAGPMPRPADQPFFGSLTVDVWLSEDDSLVGVREERESPLESMHEDIYFGLLDYCSALLGRGASGGEPYTPPWVRPPTPGEPRRGARLWTAPGSVIPRIHRRDGRGGAVRWQLTRAAPRHPTLAWRRGGESGVVPLAGAEHTAIRVTGLRIASSSPSDHAGEPDAATRHVIVTLDGPDDERERAVAVLRGWARLRAAHPVLQDMLPEGWGCILDDGAGLTTLWPAARPDPSDPSDAPAAASCDETGGTTVPWDHVLVQTDIDTILTRLRQSSRVHAYRAGRSARGRPSYAIEVTTPRTAGLWSRAKLSAWKCTVLLNARHHANEASSTSALLRLAELLAFDPAWQSYLARVNVVLAPYENPDGAALHAELQDEHPTWMLHAGRYNAAGLEFTSAYGDPLTPHAEARVLPSLWHQWVPDIVSDDHGFPSHEWVQPFAGHSNPWFRSDWIPQGLIYVFLARAVNPRYPHHLRAVEELRMRMVRALADDSAVRPLNRVYADRYRTFLHRWLPEDFPAAYEDDILIHVNDYDPDSPERTRAGLAGFAGAFPGVTTATLVTEVADETAQGHYMAVCAHAHLVADRALLQYLFDVDAPSQVRWMRSTGLNGDTLLRTWRPRPAIPMQRGQGK